MNYSTGTCVVDFWFLVLFLLVLSLVIGIAYPIWYKVILYAFTQNYEGCLNSIEKTLNTLQGYKDKYIFNHPNQHVFKVTPFELNTLCSPFTIVSKLFAHRFQSFYDLVIRSKSSSPQVFFHFRKQSKVTGTRSEM